MSRQLKIDTNLPEVQAKLAEIVRRAGSMRPALKAMGLYLDGPLGVRKRFDTETDPEGKSWQQLKPATVAGKRARGKKENILQEDQKLRDTINAQMPDDHTLLVGSPEKYAALQFLGGDLPPRVIRARRKKALNIPGIGYRKKVRFPGAHIPARQALGVSKENEEELLAIAGDYLLG